MKLLADFLPLLLFFVTYKLVDIFAATAVAIAVTVIIVGWTLLNRRKVATVLWLNLAVVVIFGGATLLLQDETFIKWKLTAYYWLSASLLLIGKLAFRKDWLRALFEHAEFELPPQAWSKLTWAWTSFLTAMGFVNLYVAYNYSLDQWVNFKLFGTTGLTLVFILVQGMFIARYLPEEPERDKSAGS